MIIRKRTNELSMFLSYAYLLCNNLNLSMCMVINSHMCVHFLIFHRVTYA
jgi:hypothetical protein